MKLRTELLAVLLTVSLLPVGVMGGLVAWHYGRGTARVIAVTKREELSTARLSADIVDQSLEGALDGLDLVRREAERRTLSPKALRVMTHAIDGLEGLTLTSARGSVVASSGPIEPTRRLPWLDMATLRMTGGPIYSPIHPNVSTGAPVMSVAVAYRRGGHFAGAVAGALDLDALRIGLGNRRALAADERLELGDSSGHSFELIAPRQEFGSGEPVLRYTAAIPGTPWHVAVVRSMAAELARPWQSALRSGLVVAVSALIVGLVGILASRRIGGAFADLASEVAHFSPADPETLPSAGPARWRLQEYEALRGTFRTLALELVARFQAVEESRRSLEASVAELRRIDRVKRDFLANISHELRTPLNHIVAYTSSLDEGVFGDVTAQQHGAIAVVLRAADHLLDQIEQLLLLSQLEAGEKEVHRDEVSLAGALDQLHSGTEQRCRAKGIHLHWEVPDRAVLIDVAKVARVMMALVDNAIKFTPEGGTISVTAAGEGDGTRIEVVDSGVGIPPTALDHVFESFYQADTSSTRRFGGLGLGLHLAWRLVAAMEGRISVQARPEGGTHATVWLPATMLE